MKENLVEKYFMAASKTRKLKYMYHVSRRDSLGLVFEQILTRVNRGHNQTFLSNILDKYRSD